MTVLRACRVRSPRRPPRRLRAAPLGHPTTAPRATPRSWAPPRALGDDVGPATPQLHASYPKPGRDAVVAARFSPDGRHLFVRDSGVVVYAFDPERGELHFEARVGFEPDQGLPDLHAPPSELLDWAHAHPSVSAFALSPDGRRVAIGSSNGHLAVYELSASGGAPARLVAEKEHALDEVACLGFVRGGARIVVSGSARGSSGLVSLDASTLRVASWTPVGRAEMHQVEELDVSPDGERVAVVGANDYFRLFAVTDAGLSEVARVELDDYAEYVRFTPDGRTLVTSGMDDVLHVWRLSEGASPLRLVQVLRGPSAKTLDLAIAPDARWVAAASDDKDVGVWPLSTDDGSVPQPIVLRPDPDEITRAIAVHPSWPWLVTGAKSLQVWRIHRGLLAAGAGAKRRVTTEAVALPWSGPPAELVAFRPSGELLTVDANGEVALQRADGGGARRVLRGGEQMPKDDFGVIRAAAIAGDRLVLGHASGDLLVVSAMDGGTQVVQGAHAKTVRAVSAAGECVLSGDEAGTASLWRVSGATLAKVASLDAGGSRVEAVALSPDAELAITSASGEQGSALRVHAIDPATCAPRAERPAAFGGPHARGGATWTALAVSDAPTSAAFSRDGAWLLTGARGGYGATLWSATGGSAFVLAAGGHGAMAAAFAPSSDLALTAGEGGTTVLWRFADSSGGAELVEILPPAASPPSGFPEAIAWSPDGARACVGGGHYRTGRVWCYAFALGR